MYVGDIQQRGALFNPMRLAYGLGLRYQSTPRFALALHAAGRGYKGKASHGGFPDALDEMSGKLWEASVMAQFSVLKWEDFNRRMFTERDPVTKGNVFLGVGAGGTLFNASFTSRVYRPRVFSDTAGNDSTVYLPTDLSGSGAGFAFHVPLVFGARYRFTPSVSLGLEMHYQLFFSDNIDGLVRNNNDGMGLIMLKLGYSFGQTKKKGVMGKTPRQTRKTK